MSNEIPPKYCHHKASGQAIVYINGRQIYLGKYRSAASREAYNRLIAEWSSSGILPKSGDALTCNELMLAYLRYAKKYYTKNGKVTTEHALIDRLHWTPLYSAFNSRIATPAIFSPLPGTTRLLIVS
jgi:hypothetical protein